MTPEQYEARILELLDANNRFEERARMAERTVDTLERNLSVVGKMLADIGRERDGLRIAIQNAHNALNKLGHSGDCIHNACVILSPHTGEPT